MRRLAIGILLVTTSFGWNCFTASADNQGSSNYQILDNTFVPAVFDASSPNFRINASVESMVGYSNSPSFNVRSGVAVKDTINPIPPVPPVPPVPPGPGGGGGGGGGGFTPPPATTSTPATTTPPVVTPTGKAKAPTLLYVAQTYLSHRVISGKLGAAGDVLMVNGSQNGVKYLADLGWQYDLPLFVGYNQVMIQVTDKSGLKSDIIGGMIERMLVGNGSRLTDKGMAHTVDDVDISLFTRAWHKYDFYSDFNEDGKIDDFDLSLLASHWNMTANY